MNLEAIKVIYAGEMRRTRNTLLQSIASPVISTCLYFVVFGSAIGSRIPSVEGVSYGAFIVPGLMMLSLLTQGGGHKVSDHRHHHIDHRKHLCGDSDCAPVLDVGVSVDDLYRLQSVRVHYWALGR